MRLVIGGRAQGKLSYVLGTFGEEIPQVWEKIPENLQVSEDMPVVINHLHLWIRERLLAGGFPEQELEEFLNYCPDCVILCDEIGNGIVPVDAFEREYRERTGRIQIELAKKAEKVERVLCGLGQRIK